MSRFRFSSLLRFTVLCCIFRIGYRLNAIKYIFCTLYHWNEKKNTPFVENYHFKNESCDICRKIAPCYWKTEQSTVNENTVQKRKWDTFCILTLRNTLHTVHVDNVFCDLILILFQITYHAYLTVGYPDHVVVTGWSECFSWTKGK